MHRGLGDQEADSKQTASKRQLQPAIGATRGPFLSDDEEEPPQIESDSATAGSGKATNQATTLKCNSEKGATVSATNALQSTEVLQALESLASGGTLDNATVKLVCKSIAVDEKTLIHQPLSFDGHSIDPPVYTGGLNNGSRMIFPLQDRNSTRWSVVILMTEDKTVHCHNPFLTSRDRGQLQKALCDFGKRLSRVRCECLFVDTLQDVEDTNSALHGLATIIHALAREASPPIYDYALWRRLFFKLLASTTDLRFVLPEAPDAGPNIPLLPDNLLASESTKAAKEVLKAAEKSLRIVKFSVRWPVSAKAVLSTLRQVCEPDLVRLNKAVSETDDDLKLLDMMVEAHEMLSPQATRIRILEEIQEARTDALARKNEHAALREVRQPRLDQLASAIRAAEEVRASREAMLEACEENVRQAEEGVTSTKSRILEEIATLKRRIREFEDLKATFGF